jgi:hypothetical protein
VTEQPHTSPADLDWYLPAKGNVLTAKAPEHGHRRVLHTHVGGGAPHTHDGETRVTASPTYHDVYIETADIPRTRLFDLPYGVEVSCTRIGGWRVWGDDGKRLLGGEYEGAKGLRLDVGGLVIVDSLTRRPVSFSAPSSVTVHGVAVGGYVSDPSTKEE